MVLSLSVLTCEVRCGAIAIFALALARPSVASGAISSWIATGLLAGLCALATLAAVLSASRGISRLVTGGIATIAAGLLLAAMFVGVRAFSGKSPGVGDQEAPVAAAIVFDIPLAVCLARNARRERVVPAEAIALHDDLLRETLASISREGFR